MTHSAFRKFALIIFLCWPMPWFTIQAGANWEDPANFLSAGTKTDRPSQAKRSSLGRRISELYHAGEFSNAIPAAQEALELWEKAAGPDHPSTAAALNNLAGLYLESGDWAKAEPLFERALSIEEKAHGPEHPETARTLNNLGGLYNEMGYYTKAEPLFQRALTIRQRALGPEHPDTATTLNNLAGLYREMGAFAKAEPLFQQALRLKEQALGPDHPDTATFLNNLAAVYRDMGDYPKAEPLFQRALGIAERTLAPGHPNIITFLSNLAELYGDMGDYSKAERFNQQALKITEKARGRDPQTYAMCLDTLAAMYLTMGKYAKAEVLYQQGLKITEKVLGPGHPGAAMALNHLTGLYREMGNYAKAESLCQEALTITEKAFGPDHPSTAPAFHNLAALYCEMGDYAKAEPLYQRALQIIEKELGFDHPTTVSYIGGLVELYREMGNYSKAELLCQRALTIEEKTFGPDHPNVVTVLTSLAPIYREMGNYAKAEGLLQRALKIAEKALGPDHPTTSTAINYLARLYSEMGNYIKAELLLQRALRIVETALGPDHPYTASALDHLARLYHEVGAYAAAEPLLKRELKIEEKLFGSDHQRTATALNNLAKTYREMGDYKQAEFLFWRALESNQKALGANHPETATFLDNLAGIYRRTGDYATAAPLVQRALKIAENALGPEHLTTAAHLNSLAWLYIETELGAKALPLLQRALRIIEKALGPDHPRTIAILNSLVCLNMELGKAENTVPLLAQMQLAKEKQLADILSFTSEEQRLAFQRTTDPYTLLASFGHTVELVETILRQKGIVLDSLLEDRLIAGASNDPKQRENIERVYAIKQRLMQSLLEAPKDLTAAAQKRRAADKETLSTEVDQLESGLARQVAGLGKARRALSVTVAQIQSTLPPQTVLVELLKYYHYVHRGHLEQRYGAALIAAKGEPKWVPLGSAEEIEGKLQLYRKSARNETDETTLKTVLTTLGRELWEPIEKVLATGTTTIIISPDAELNFLSFATLLRTDNRFVGEKYSISYIASGRDLLRETPGVAEVTTSLRVFASPDLGPRGSKAYLQEEEATKAALRSAKMRDLQSISLPDLPWTKTESAGLKLRAEKLGWLVQESLGPNATEAELRKVTSPRILHLATHGFFLPEIEPNMPSRGGGAVDIPKGKLVNPMHRSGVAMAGARTTLQLWGQGEAPPTENDGILTAEEVGGLQLDGTWLVVLSACDTGSGEAKAGEGVMGLRRGFVQTGTQNLLMTLWPISDETTVKIMFDFYDAAFKTGNAPQALADTQRNWLVNLRNERGLLPAVQLAGPFIMSLQGKP
jgi:tetratricopeptide (TPR) repeat protein